MRCGNKEALHGLSTRPLHRRATLALLRRIPMFMRPRRPTISGVTRRRLIFMRPPRQEAI